MLKTGNFPDNLADITPVFKKKNPSHKVNYRPVSVLPSISKVFEKLMQKQISGYINYHISPYMCGYRKGFSSQQALMSLIKNWKRVLDKTGFGGAVLMDLSKAFDTIKHDLLIAKLYAYGFSKESLELLHSYLSNRWHRTKINKQFSSWQELIQGVPQGSVLGPLLFNIYLNDLFYIAESTNVCNFADDTTFYLCDGDVNSLINRLEHDSYLVIEWFENNSMKLNQDKCHLLVSGFKYENVWAKIGKTKIWESKKQKLSSVEIDRTLSFDEYITSLCRKARKKLSVLARLSNFMCTNKKRVLMKAFIESQFSYCPLILMFHSRGVNNKINHLHERSLRIVYKDNISSFEDLLKKDRSFTIHQRNILSLAIELFKVKGNLSNDIMYDIFQTRKIKYNLRSQTKFASICVNTKKFSLNSLGYFTSKVWSMVPLEIKISGSIEIFKTKIQIGSLKIVTVTYVRPM